MAVLTNPDELVQRQQREGKSGNTALLRTAAAFCHPVTIAAVAIMLLNDHLFKAWWPGSWATGKLSDAAWVTFAPLFVALLASLLLPRRLKRRDSLVQWVSLAVTAVSYFLFNTWDPFHQLVNGFFSNTVGWGTVEKDPTDNVTLAALALTWWIWWRPVNTSVLRSRALVVGAVAALATMATSPSLGDEGISYLSQDGPRLLAASQYWGSGAVTAYTSSDGGLVWEPMKQADFPTLASKPLLETRILGSGSVRYRFLVGASVERSDDGGRTWRQDYDLSQQSSRMRRMYYEERVPPRLPGSSVTVVALPVPLDAVLDTTTGNLVLAMGQDGVLVRTAEGRWSWASVGPYRFQPIGHLNLLSLVYAEFLIAIVFAILSLATILRSLGGKGIGSLVALVLAWAWLFFVILSLPVRSLEHPSWLSETAYVFMSFPALVGALVAFGLSGSVTHWRAALAWRILAALVVEYALFVLPLVLWSQGLIEDYRVALWLGVILGVAVTGAAILYLMMYRRHNPPATQDNAPSSAADGRQNPPVLP